MVPFQSAGVSLCVREILLNAPPHKNFSTYSNLAHQGEVVHLTFLCDVLVYHAGNIWSIYVQEQLKTGPPTCDIKRQSLSSFHVSLLVQNIAAR